MNQLIREATRWGSRRLSLVVAVVVACATVLSGCDTGQKASGPPRARVRTGSSTHSRGAVADPDVSSQTGQIVSGWLAAERAFEHAARTADAEEPDLLATTVAPVLGAAMSDLQRMQASDQIAVGPTAVLGTPVVAEVTSRLATVQDCAYDAEITVDRANGRPVAGIAGERGDEDISSVMELTTTGWELAEQTVVEVSACAAS